MKLIRGKPATHKALMGMSWARDSYKALIVADWRDILIRPTRGGWSDGRRFWAYRPPKQVLACHRDGRVYWLRVPSIKEITP